LTAFIGFMLLRALLRSDPKTIHIRGRRLISYEEALKHATENLNSNGVRKRPKLHRLLFWGRKPPPPPEPLWDFGGCRMTLKAASEHTLVTGTTGSGKTTLLRSYMRDLLPLVPQNPHFRALLYDASRDLSSYLATLGVHFRAVILNPFDTRSAEWDMAADMDTPGTATELAALLIKEEQDTNPYFPNAARDIMRQAVTAFQVRAPGNWNFRDLVLACRSQDSLRAILDTPRTRDLLSTYFNPKANIDAIMSTIATKVSPFEVVAAAWHRASRRQSLRKWLSTNQILILPNDEAHRASIDPLNQLIFKRASDLLLEYGPSEERKTFYWLDEVREAGQLPGLRALMTKGRKYGACVFLGYQSQRGMEAVFKEPEADELAGLSAQRAYLRLQDASADWASKCLGEEEVWEPQTTTSRNNDGSTSTSLTYHRVTRPIVPASVLRDTPLPTPEAGLFATYDSSRIGVWQVVIPAGNWPPRPSEEAKRLFPDYLPRPVAHQILEPWGPKDYARLGIRPPPPPTAPLRLRPPASPPRPVSLPGTRP
jgi:hypothetical protein